MFPITHRTKRRTKNINKCPSLMEQNQNQTASHSDYCDWLPPHRLCNKRIGVYKKNLNTRRKVSERRNDIWSWNLRIMFEWHHFPLMLKVSSSPPLTYFKFWDDVFPPAVATRLLHPNMTKHHRNPWSSSLELDSPSPELLHMWCGSAQSDKVKLTIYS